MKHMTLRAARDAKKWTQQQLAAASGVEQTTISKIECETVTDPANSTVSALEIALGVQRGTLIFGSQSRVA